MAALLLVLAVVPAIWTAQTLLLRLAGLPPRFRVDTGDAPNFVRAGSRAVTNLALAAVIVAYPPLIGRPVVDYYAAMFPAADLHLAPLGFCLSAAYLAVLYAAWNAADCVRFAVRHDASRLARRLMTVPLSAVFGATIEELLFRGVLLQGLLDAPQLSKPAAVLLAAALFAAAHYVRKVKRYWTAAGHLVLGLCLCTAYLCSGSLWLPIGIHAGGIFVIMAVRPCVRYVGPAWVTGSSIFPFAGGVGIAALALMTAAFAHLVTVVRP